MNTTEILTVIAACCLFTNFLAVLIYRKVKNMSAIDDLTAAVNALPAAASAVVAALEAAKTTNDDAALDALKTTVEGVVTQLNTAVTPA